MAFFEALRAAASRYAAGVHFLGRPADARAMQALAERAGWPLPSTYRDFLRSFDGVALFLEAQTLLPCDEIQPVPGVPQGRAYLHIGDCSDGALWLDPAGKISLADESAPDPIVVGSHIEAYLESTLAREALVVDRQGEFREVFVGDDELDPTVRKKRAKLGQRHDPGAALPLLELAELAYEEGDAESAQAALQQAVQLDPLAGPAWGLLAALYHAAGQLTGAEHAALQAASGTWHGPLQASRLLQAARACPMRATQHAREAWRADPQLAERLLGEAQAALDAAEVAEARHLVDQLQLLLAAAPVEGTEAAQLGQAQQKLDALAKQVRTRSALHVVE